MGLRRRLAAALAIASFLGAWSGPLAIACVRAPAHGCCCKTPAADTWCLPDCCAVKAAQPAAQVVTSPAPGAPVPVVPAPLPLLRPSLRLAPPLPVMWAVPVERPPDRLRPLRI